MANIVGLSPEGRFVQRSLAEAVFTRPWELVIGKKLGVEIITTLGIIIATLGIALIGLIVMACVVVASKDKLPDHSRKHNIKVVNADLNKLPHAIKIQVLEKIQEQAVNKTMNSKESREWSKALIEYFSDQGKLLPEDPAVVKVLLESYELGCLKDPKGIEDRSIEEMVKYFLPVSGKLLEVFLPEIDEFATTLDLTPIYEIADGIEGENMKIRFVLGRVYALVAQHFTRLPLLQRVWGNIDTEGIVGKETVEYYKNLYNRPNAQTCLDKQKQININTLQFELYKDISRPEPCGSLGNTLNIFSSHYFL